jgi:hypothetical protein
MTLPLHLHDSAIVTITGCVTALLIILSILVNSHHAG